MTQTGTVTRWVEGRYGWVVPDDHKPSIFLHSSKAPEGLKEGMRIEFRIGTSDRGDYCFDVKLTDKPYKPARKRAKA